MVPGGVGAAAGGPGGGGRGEGDRGRVGGGEGRAQDGAGGRWRGGGRGGGFKRSGPRRCIRQAAVPPALARLASPSPPPLCLPHPSGVSSELTVSGLLGFSESCFLPEVPNFFPGRPGSVACRCCSPPPTPHGGAVCRRGLQITEAQHARRV